MENMIDFINNFDECQSLQGLECETPSNRLHHP